jgi:hypothetical protein
MEIQRDEQQWNEKRCEHWRERERDSFSKYNRIPIARSGGIQ